MFSTLDLKDGFFHVTLHEDSVKYMAFVTPNGHYEFLKVPFGLCNSPAAFQRDINAKFRRLIDSGVVLVYLDDLIIPSRDETESLHKLKLVLDTASKNRVIINWNKCELLGKRVKYLGYVIENGAIKPSKRKTEAVKRFPIPINVKMIQCFLGLIGFFRKFIPQYLTTARPFTQLKDGVRFEFGPEQEHAFQCLKTSLSRGPVLKLYRTDAETELHTDASKFGLGAILLQKDSEDGLFHPIHYASWKTSSAEEKYCSYELEILAVVKSLKKFRPYLLGISFKIVTDCKAFALTMEKKDICARIATLMLSKY